MSLLKFYSHLARPVTNRFELFLLLLSVAMPNVVLLPFVGSFSVFVVVFIGWCLLVATLYCLYKEKKHIN